jgi:hypothetical protein
MESEHRATNVRVVGSSPSVLTKFLKRGECKESRGRWFKLILAGSNPAFPANFFRGRLTGRTTGSEPVNRGSNPFPEARNFFRAFRRWLNGLDLESSARRFKSCRPDHARVVQLGRGACLRNKRLRVRISPRVPPTSMNLSDR